MGITRKSYTLKGIQDEPTFSTQNLVNTHQNSDDRCTKQKQHWYQSSYLNPFISFFYITMCSVLLTLSSVFVKQLTYISPGELSMIRNLGVFVGCLPIAIYSVKEVLGPKKYWGLLYVRAFLGSTALYLNLLAFRFLPLVIASIIMSTLPALVTVVARFYLKEPCGFVQCVAIALTILGMLLSIRLPDVIKNHGLGQDSGSTDYITGLSCAIGCVLILSLTFVFLRKMTKVHFSVVLIYFGLLGTIENAVLTTLLADWTFPRCGWDSVQVILIGILGFGSHCCLTLALQKENAGIVSVVKSSTDIIVAMAFQPMFFGTLPDLYTVGGALIVMSSLTIIGVQKWLKSLPRDSKHRKRGKFLLL